MVTLTWCTLCLHACQVRVTVGESGLCCPCVMYFKPWLTPLCVDSALGLVLFHCCCFFIFFIETFWDALSYCRGKVFVRSRSCTECVKPTEPTPTSDGDPAEPWTALNALKKVDVWHSGVDSACVCWLERSCCTVTASEWSGCDRLFQAVWILQCNPSLKTVNKNLLNKWTVPDVVAAVGERGEWG